MSAFPEGAGGHRRARRHRRRVDRASPDRARLGRHRRHRQVGHPDRHRLDGACLGLLLRDQPRLPDLLDDALLGFFEKMGHYARIGGIEVARVGDDERMDEIRRKVDSGKAFGTRVRLMDPPRSRRSSR